MTDVSAEVVEETAEVSAGPEEITVTVDEPTDITADVSPTDLETQVSKTDDVSITLNTTVTSTIPEEDRGESWFRSVDLNRNSFDITRNADDQITDIDVAYDELETEYDATWASGTGEIDTFDRTVLLDDLQIHVQDHQTTHTRDSNGRITQMTIDLETEVVTYSISWSDQTTVDSFSRSVTNK